MKKYLLTVISTICITLLVSTGMYAEEPVKSVATLMGLSIQNYLEGDIRQAVKYLDEVLTREPGHEKAGDLLEKAVSKIVKDMKQTGNFAEDMVYVEIGKKHLPESGSIKNSVNEIEEFMGQIEKEKMREEKDKQKEEKKLQQEKEKQEKDSSKKAEWEKAQTNEETRRQDEIRKKKEQAGENQAAVTATTKYTAVSAVSKKDMSLIKSQIGKLEKDMTESVKYGNMTSTRVGEILIGMEDVLSNIAALERRAKKTGLSFWIIMIVMILGIAGIGAGLFLMYKKETAEYSKSVALEMQALEEMKLSYSKDTEEMAKTIIEYGKAQERVSQMEKKWEKILGILDRVTRGGSTHKVILKDSPDGRKAVTGVDPRVRARADSVDVIADIFKDSSRATEMLKPFLDDRDNRTRGNAAVAYHRYDPEKAMAVLQDMATSNDKWMRISAAWALGEIGDSSTSRILETLLDDSDTQVKNKARVSFEKIIGNQQKDGLESGTLSEDEGPGTGAPPPPPAE
ncbi:MAG: HEAT repeat domain-containing protein [Elusimicrobiota bacterium]